MATPEQLYRNELDAQLMSYDPHQERVVEHLQMLYENLLQYSSGAVESPSKIGRLFSRFAKADKQNAPKGIYLWGGVGRGKTHLCDMFYKSVPGERKLRMHYHRFMLLIHNELTALGSVSEPMDLITRGWAEKVDLLVLDEMHINDITDAMLMRHLLKGLFDCGVVLVTTSNRPPRDLYHNGLQREQFLPAIELLYENTEVLNLDSETDYRLRALEHTETYLTPIDETVTDKLEAAFFEISGHDEEQIKYGEVIINDRNIPMVKRAAGVIWISFDALCDSPRSNKDYIEFTNYFHTVILCDVPVMDVYREDAARRFVNMVDEFYDHGTKLIISAHAPAEAIYTGETLAFEFQRAVSRLQEMQSHEYLAKERVFDCES